MKQGAWDRASLLDSCSSQIRRVNVENLDDVVGPGELVAEFGEFGDHLRDLRCEIPELPAVFVFSLFGWRGRRTTVVGMYRTALIGFRCGIISREAILVLS